MSKGSLGQLLCWLETPKATRTEHQAIKTSNRILTFERRSSWREWACQAIPEAVEAERQQRGGDASEPLHTA